MKIAESLRPLARPMTSVTRLPDADNPRKRSHVDDLAASLERFGQRKPIVVGPDGVIAAGNHLHKAAEQIGATEIAVADADDMDPGELRAYVLADNRLADLGSYDPVVLAGYLEGAADTLAGLVGTGFDPEDVDDVLAQLQEQENPDLASFGVTMGEAHRDYEAHAVRSIVLFYVGKRFLWVTDRMQELRDRFGVVSTADAILALLEESSGLEAPHEIG